MEFNIGKYKTRDGNDAVVLIDWMEYGVDIRYPLEGYIVRDGIKYVDSWTSDGRNGIAGGSHHDDLMPPAPRRVERMIYLDSHPEQEIFGKSCFILPVDMGWSITSCGNIKNKYRMILEEVIE